MAAPSPSMCPVLIGDTMLCSVVDGISLTETCPLWLREWVSTVKGMFWSCPNHEIFCHTHTCGLSGHPN